MKAIRIIFKFFGTIILLSIFFLIIAAVFATLSDYKPPDREILTPTDLEVPHLINKDRVSVMTWNIGYAGLGEQMDFFYDGGTRVRPKQKYYNETYEGIHSFLKQSDTIDFIFIQEVDKKAHRSYRNNQVGKINSILPGYQSVFAKNYDVLFVPVPFNSPMGKVVSGMMNLSKYQPATSERISFPGNFNWPKSIFFLDRCFIIQRFLTKDEKILTLINTHNSAFDDGSLREQQFALLRQTALEEYAKGNYVIIGGDWNQNPPGFNSAEIENGDLPGGNDLPNVPYNFMPSGWNWVFDPAVPTNRDVSTPYERGLASATVLDYFLLSPNLGLVNIKTIDMAFKYSDHNPVVMEVKLGQ